MKFKEIVTVAHNVEEGDRTADVGVSESVDFASLLLSSAVREGLTRQGFKRPSPIQLKAIPVGKLGLDMVVQAKSGTGKTCVFSVLALEMVQLQNPAPQVVIVAPTREIATQIFTTVQAIGVNLKSGGLRVGLFIGGASLMQDKAVLRGGCQVIVGTPGRLCQLVQTNSMSLGAVRLFVLDEADKLMEDSYQQNVNYLFSRLPPSKQVAVFSATYPRQLDELLSQYMSTPTMVRLDSSNVQLLGIKQYLVVCPRAVEAEVINVKLEFLFKFLERVQYTQCLVFCNYQDKCQMVCDALNERGYEAQYIAGTLGQDERNRVMKKLKLFQTRLLVSTDLTARGIDAPNVNMVVNLEVPQDCETYFHRIGRAGRFGGYGAAITIAVEGLDDRRFGFLGMGEDFQVKFLPDLELTPTDLCTCDSFWQSLPLIDFKKEIGRMNKRTKTTAEDETENGGDDSIVFYGKPSPVKKAQPVSTAKKSVKKEKPVVQPLPDPNRLSPEMWMDQFGSRSKEAVTHVDRQPPFVYDRSDLLNLRHRPDAQSTVLSASKDDFFRAVGLDTPVVEQKKRRYDRVKLLEIRDSLPSSFIESHALSTDLNVLSTMQTNYSTELDDMKLLMKSEKKPMQPKESADNKPIQIRVVDLKPKLAPFVPARLRNKTKYYMRGELLSVRGVVDADAWRRYAESKWDLTELPFRFANFDDDLVDSVTPKSSNQGDSVVDADSVIPCSTASTDEHLHTTALTFSRDTMLKMRDSLMPHQWKALAEKSWDITVDPFVTDAELRCPVSQQLRIVRARQMVAQKAVLEQRKQKARQTFVVAQVPRIKPSADHCIAESKWPFGPHYELQMAADLQTFLALRQEQCTVQPRRGPVVARRRCKAEWTRVLLDAETTLQNERRDFEQAVNAKMLALTATDDLTSATEDSTSSTESKVLQRSPPIGQHGTIRYNRDDMMTIWEDVVRLDVDVRMLPSIQRSQELGLFVFREFTIDDDDEVDEEDASSEGRTEPPTDTCPPPIAYADLSTQTEAVFIEETARRRLLPTKRKSQVNEDDNDNDNDNDNDSYETALALYYARMQQWQEMYDRVTRQSQPSAYQQINSYVTAMARAHFTPNQ